MPPEPVPYKLQVGDVITIPQHLGKWVVESAYFTTRARMHGAPVCWEVTARQLLEDTYNPDSPETTFFQADAPYCHYQKVGKMTRHITFD